MLIFLTVVGAVLLGLVIVVIYLNDRVNELERRTAAAGGGGGGGGGGASPSPSWQGLTGKKLWDVMCGKKGVTDLPPAAIEEMRPVYEGVLTQHIQALFRAGQSDGRKGQAVQPTATRMLPSTLGNVQSWIPLNHANAIYRAGFDSNKEDIFEAERARMTLDETAQVLFAQTQFNPTQSFSEMMMAAAGTGAAEDPAGLAPAGALASGSAGLPALGSADATGSASGGAGAAPFGAAANAGAAAPAAAAAKGMFAASAPASGASPSASPGGAGGPGGPGG